MPSHSPSFLFDAAGTAPVSFQIVSHPSTLVLMLGVVGLILVAWCGRKDARVWLAPLVLLVFMAVVETENYLDSAQRFDQISVDSTGVVLDSRAADGAGRFIAFKEISSIETGPSGRFGQACRLKVALTSGEEIYSVNFFDACGSVPGTG